VRARALRQSSPDAERRVWSKLRDRKLGGYKFRRQRPIAGYIVDFVCLEAMLVIELDGSQNFEPAAVEADTRRTKVLSANGFHVLRFDNRQALAETAAVLLQVLEWLQRHHPHPNPLPQAGEGVVLR
jgi:very-short-patch-repair endonuclease